MLAIYEVLFDTSPFFQSVYLQISTYKLKRIELLLWVANRAGLYIAYWGRLVCFCTKPLLKKYFCIMFILSTHYKIQNEVDLSKKKKNNKRVQTVAIIVLVKWKFPELKLYM